MLLIYTQKLTPRITYIFRHICTEIIGLQIGFTTVIEEFIGHQGPKLSYGRKQLGNEFFIQSHDLLFQSGLENMSIEIKDWNGTKCFFEVSENSSVPFDIFAASFYLISRYEEYLPYVKDVFGRFPATESLAYKENILMEPVVDIWAMEFKKTLSNYFPDLKSIDKETRRHYIFMCPEPFKYLNKGFLRSVVGFFKDFGRLRLISAFRRIRVLLGLSADPYNTFGWIINKLQETKSKVTMLFKLSDPDDFEKGFNTHRQLFAKTIKYVGDYHEIGLIFHDKSIGDNELLKLEKKRIEKITLRPLESSVNMDYNLNLPEAYRNLIELELARDFTMVYNDLPGFRASTCTPFLFYDLDYELLTPLRIHPVCATTYAFKDRYKSDIIKTLNTLMSSVNSVQGVFSIVFTNIDFVVSKKSKSWRDLLDKIETKKEYE